MPWKAVSSSELRCQNFISITFLVEIHISSFKLIFNKPAESIGFSIKKYDSVFKAATDYLSSIENDVKVILDKRKDNLKKLSERCQCSTDKGELSAALEYILPEPRYAGFLETAFALSARTGTGW